MKESCEIWQKQVDIAHEKGYERLTPFCPLAGICKKECLLEFLPFKKNEPKIPEKRT